MKIIQKFKRAFKAVSSLTASSSCSCYFFLLFLYFAWQIKATVHSLRATALSEQSPKTAKQTL